MHLLKDERPESPPLSADQRDQQYVYANKHSYVFVNRDDLSEYSIPVHDVGWTEDILRVISEMIKLDWISNVHIKAFIRLACSRLDFEKVS
ncbi:hypothetical protein [Pelagicoccus mobilis]